MPKYQVTDRAGSWVAGRKVAPGDILTLTEEQAEYEIARGMIAPYAPPPPMEEARSIEASPNTMHIASAPRRRGKRR